MWGRGRGRVGEGVEQALQWIKKRKQCWLGLGTGLG